MQRKRCQTFSLMVALVLLAGCASNTTSIKFSTATPQGFPSFSDWRVAYIGQDSHLEVISLNGKTTLEGIQLSIYGPQASGIWTAGTSPDGTHLAYSAGGAGMNYIDVHADDLTNLSHAAVYNNEFLWAPDGHSIELEGANKATAIVALSTGVVAQPSAKDLDAHGNVATGATYGWLDNTHLAVEYLPGETPNVPATQMGTPQTAANLDSLDVSTGVLRHIATIQSNTMAQGQFSLTPDGAEALFYNTDWRDFPFTPEVERVDTATGQVTSLPHLTSILTTDGFTQVLWIPHTHLALVATGYPQNKDLRYQMMDIDHDTASPVALSAFPVAWSPDGKTLILATSDPTSNSNGIGFADVGVIGSGPYTLTAVTFDSNWHIATTVMLTHEAMQIPTLGFVRTV